MTEQKNIRFDFKSVSNGTFEGLLATYGNLDEVGDIIEPGAFKKTLNDNGGTVPLLWQHRTAEPIGKLILHDSSVGLKAFGTLSLELSRAQEAYVCIKQQLVRALSIGFQAIVADEENGVRHLKEVRLYEGSLVTFPANTQAVITSVKSAEATERDAAILRALEGLRGEFRRGAELLGRLRG